MNAATLCGFFIGLFVGYALTIWGVVWTDVRNNVKKQ